MAFFIVVVIVIAVIWAVIVASIARKNRIINNPDFQEVYQRGKKIMSILRRGEVSALQAVDFDLYRSLCKDFTSAGTKTYICGYFEWHTTAFDLCLEEINRAKSYDDKNNIAMRGCVSAGIFKDMADAELFDKSSGMDAIDLLWDYAHVDPQRADDNRYGTLKKYVLSFPVWPAIGSRPWTEEEAKTMAGMLNST